MYISKVSLINYRNFENAKFLFKKGINTIIGENGSGIFTSLFIDAMIGSAANGTFSDTLLKGAHQIGL